MSRDDRELELRSNAAVGPDRLAFRTADGVRSPDAFREGTLLALAGVEPPRDADVLVVDANYGVLPTVLGALTPEGRTVATETGARARRLAARNVADNGVDATVELVASPADVAAADVDVAVYVPYAYDPVEVVRDRIAAALAVLAPGGELSLAAAPTTGLNRYRDALGDLAADVETIRSRGEYDLLRARRPADYEAPETDRRRTLTATVDGVDAEFRTSPGLFAADAVDHGTELLCGALPDELGRVLDLCCGYGVVGVYAALAGAESVTMTDDDRVAVERARESVAANGVDADVVPADAGRGVEGPFDLVASNPPTHAGDGVLRDLVDRAAAVLTPDGAAYLVHNRAVDLATPLARRFDDVTAVAAGEEHFVQRARGPS
jgi:16S rRNA (guanine1207-N2)-methyltransferase